MKKMILTAVLTVTALTGIAAASATTPTAQPNDMKSRIVYFVHYHTWYAAPVYYYRPVVVAPVYPVYTVHYWYYKLAGN